MDLGTIVGLIGSEFQPREFSGWVINKRTVEQKRPITPRLFYGDRDHGLVAETDVVDQESSFGRNG